MPTENAALGSALQQLHADTRVDLFILDATSLGAGVYRFTSTPTQAPLQWQGNSYPFVPVEVDGFEWSGQGQLPTPSITIAAVNTVFAGLVIAAKDLLGAKVTRYRTFAKFLDNGSSPDSTAYLPPDEYRVEQKTAHTKQVISWQLSAILDKQGHKVPKRIALRSTCMHTYRVFASGGFNYANASCPYAGNAYFKQDGTVATNAADDKCGKRVSDCKLRFGEDGSLPTRAFPGIAQFRV